MGFRYLLVKSPSGEYYISPPSKVLYKGTRVIGVYTKKDGFIWTDVVPEEDFEKVKKSFENEYFDKEYDDYKKFLWGYPTDKSMLGIPLLGFSETYPEEDEHRLECRICESIPFDGWLLFVFKNGRINVTNALSDRFYLKLIDSIDYLVSTGLVSFI